MSNNRLNVIYTENKQSGSPQESHIRTPKEEIQASMERLWLKDPQQFDPLRDSMERNRIKITFETMRSLVSLKGKKVVDLGCGSGVLSRKIRDDGAAVDAIDAAAQALEKLKAQNMDQITPIQDCLPATKLKDGTYDLVVCTELIGYLKAADFRLLMAELARLAKCDGLIICSTELDIDTDNALDRFAALAETEFTIEKWALSYHYLQIRLCRFFEKPAHYLKSFEDAELRQKKLAKLNGFKRRWFAWNTTAPLIYVWKMAALVFNPLSHFLRQNEPTMRVLEKITKFFWSECGISHALFAGKRRPLTFPVKPENTPRELKHKRQVWE